MRSSADGADDDIIANPEQCTCHGNLIDAVFEDLTGDMSNRVNLTPKNEESLLLNDQILAALTALLRMMAKHRKFIPINLGGIIDFITHQLQGPVRLHGYRWMCNKFLKNSIRAKKENARLILAALYPDASAICRSRHLNHRQCFAQGPNYCISGM